MSITTFKYKIVKFDIENRVIKVEFNGDNNSWAQIQLSMPLPRNIEELESLIKQYTESIEVMDARYDSSVDLSYITDLIDKEQEADRYSLTTSFLTDLMAEEVVL